MNEDIHETGDPISSGIDLSALRLPQDYSALAPVKKIITTIPIRKPDKHWFIRVHPEWRFECATLEIREGFRNETFVVKSSLAGELLQEVVPKTFYPTIAKQGTLFLWPIKLPGPEGRLDHWNESARIAAERAKDQWVRLVHADSAYDLLVAQGNLADPEWPADLAFEQMLEIAFKGRVIDNLEHPILRQLRGEI